MAFGSFTLTGQFFGLDGATPATGRVTIDGNPQVVVDSAGDKFRVGPRTVVLDAQGKFSTTLPSDATTGNSTGIAFRVTVNLKHQNLNPVNLYARPIGATVDLADITSAAIPELTVLPAGPAGPAGTPGATGATGAQGPAGLPGVNAVANDTATASYITTSGSATDAALRAAGVPRLGPRPYYLDAYNKFLTDGWVWVAGQGTAPTTLTAQATAGATTLAVAAGATFPTGVILVTNAGTSAQQILKVTGGGGTNTLTVTPAVSTTLASGATITPLWVDNGHMNGNTGWTAFAWWIMQQTRPDGSKVIQDPGSTKPVVFLGNSWMTPTNATYYTNVVKGIYPSANVVMAGVAGNTSAQILARFDTDCPSNAAYVIINEPGVNDSGTNVTLATQQANLEALVAKVRGIGAIPVVTGGPPLSDYPIQARRQQKALTQAFSNPNVFPASSVASLDDRFSGVSVSGSYFRGAGDPGKVDTSGSATGVGQGVLTANTTGAYATAVGGLALASQTTGNSNTVVGYGSGVNVTTGNNNLFVGYASAQLVTTGSRNTALGDETLQQLTTGNEATAVGHKALLNATSGSNSAVGAFAGALVTTGQGNTIFGNWAGYSPNFNNGAASTTANSQTIIGAYAGQNSATQRDDVTAIGNTALVGATGATAIGRNTQAIHTDSVALGRSSVTTQTFQVMIGPRDIETTDATKGLVLKSPNGTRYRLTVSDAGAAVWTAA